MKKIINKVLEELKSENPKLDYIRGLLEAISEDNEERKENGMFPYGKIMQNSPVNDVPLPPPVNITPPQGGIIKMPQDDTHLIQ